MSVTAKKIIAGLILFGSGLIVGFFGARLSSEHGTLALLHGHEHFAEMALQRLRVDLDLSDEQVKKLRPIMMETARKLAEIRQEQEPKIQTVLENDFSSIKKILTPEQAERFDAKIKDLRERRRSMERFGPPPPPPGMGPPPDGPPPDLGPPDLGPPPGMGPPPPHRPDEERQGPHDKSHRPPHPDAGDDHDPTI